MRRNISRFALLFEPVYDLAHYGFEGELCLSKSAFQAGCGWGRVWTLSALEERYFQKDGRVWDVNGPDDGGSGNSFFTSFIRRSF